MAALAPSATGCAGKQTAASFPQLNSDTVASYATSAPKDSGIEFVYPYGCTLSVQRPAVPVLSSGRIAYPMSRPLAAAWWQVRPGDART